MSEIPPTAERTRVVRRSEAFRSILDPLHHALKDAERRFLALQSTAATSTEVLGEYLGILAELGAVDERLREISGRRDIPYVVDRRATQLHDYCRWLVRRVSAVFLLILQVNLEQDFKQLIGPDAYQMFLRLEEVVDAAREIEALSDRELMTRVREGTLLREVLEQARLGDLMGGVPPDRLSASPHDEDGGPAE
ncbi:MAG: hypothetical protein ACT4PY_06595 [Armatimonadota bacterium]